MSNTWLIVDTHNVAWRSHHAMKGLSHDGKPTAVLFGFLRDVVHFRGKFRADSCVFCFDQGRSLREKEYPFYKANRRKDQGDWSANYQERVKELAAVKEQLFDLQLILPAVGFKNMFHQQGYEADDLIASACLDSLPEGDEAVILGSDRDMLQLLSGQVSIWNYRSHVTLQSFWQEWKLEPKHWIDVKALAGCSSDGIKGIKGVGEITAARFIKGELKSGKTLDRIASEEGHVIWDRNRKLVELPWPGLKPMVLREDHPDPDTWDRTCQEHGMDSLIGLLSGKRRVIR